MPALTEHALAGTARARGRPQTETAADTWLEGDDEAVLLRALAVAAVTRAARPAATRPIPPAPPVESGVELSPGAAQAIHRLLDEPDLLAEALQLVAQSNRILPVELLPALRDKAPPPEVLGGRGRWLLAQMVDPSNEVAPDAWVDGKRADRLAWLTRTRAQAPEVAREAVEAVFASEPADLRAAMLATFAVNLRVADEPFLLACFADRAPSVRRAAAERLATLPTFSARLRERALSLAAADFSLPDPLPPEWLREGVDGAKAQERLRALVSLVDPAVWPDLAGMLAHRAWGDVLRPALVEAAALHASPLSARIFKAAPSPRLLPLLPDAYEAVRALVPSRTALVSALLVALPAPWPEPLAAAVVASLRFAYATRGDWPDAFSVVQRARVALPVVFADTLAEPAGASPVLARLRDALELRRSVHRALSGP